MTPLDQLGYTSFQPDICLADTRAAADGRSRGALGAWLWRQEAGGRLGAVAPAPRRASGPHERLAAGAHGRLPEKGAAGHWLVRCYVLPDLSVPCLAEADSAAALTRDGRALCVCWHHALVNQTRELLRHNAQALAAAYEWLLL